MGILWGKYAGESCNEYVHNLHTSVYIHDVFVVCLFLQGSTVILKTITNDWGAYLTPSAKKYDFVYKYARKPGAHTKITINGVSLHKCVPGKGCQKYQHRFQVHSTALQIRMFCKGHDALA